MNEADKLARYRELLLSWSAKINLIGPEARRNLDAHLAEAVAAAQILQPAGEVVDVGSGGGLPAIPMAITSPHARFHLVDSDTKKWAFLKHVIRECELNSVAYDGRLAEVAGRFDPAIRFSLVTSRAVGHPETWLPPLLPLLASEARVALFQGNDEAPEIGGLEHERTARLPRGEANFLVILKRST